jgi:mannosyltransferase
MRALEAVVPNIKRRQTGVTSTLISAVRAQAALRPVAAMGFGLPRDLPRVGFASLLGAWRRPPGRSHRIWHARRPDEMWVGLILRDLLRQPWKLVFTSHDAYDHPWFYRFCAARMDALVAPTRASADAIDPRAEIIPLGVDTDDFQPSPDRAAAWQALGLPGRYGVATFGRIRHQKGQDLLLKAALPVLARHPDAGLVLAGLTTGAHAEYEAKLRARVAEAGLAERVRFLGEVDGATLRALYRAALVYVQPGRSEGYGLTPLEAMASGTAVISTRVGAAADMIVEGVTGHLCAVDDAAAIGARLDERLSDIAGTTAMGQAGRAHVLAEFGTRREAERLIALYDRLVTPRPLAPAAPAR